MVRELCADNFNNLSAPILKQQQDEGGVLQLHNKANLGNFFVPKEYVLCLVVTVMYLECVLAFQRWRISRQPAKINVKEIARKRRLLRGITTINSR